MEFSVAVQAAQFGKEVSLGQPSYQEPELQAIRDGANPELLPVRLQDPDDAGEDAHSLSITFLSSCRLFPKE